MAEEVSGQPERSGASRRQALKLGVAAGIGVAAWSGPTITSLGGTPAYAATCTNFTVNENLADRNTDQAANCDGSHRYKPPGLTLPAGYTMPFFPAAGHCNDVRFNTALTFPAGVTCRVNVKVYENGLFATGPYAADITFGPATSPLSVYLPAVADYVTTPPPNARWSLLVQCVPSEVAACF